MITLPKYNSVQPYRFKHENENMFSKYLITLLHGLKSGEYAEGLVFYINK